MFRQHKKKATERKGVLEIVFTKKVRERAEHGPDGRIMHQLEDSYKHFEIVGVDGAIFRFRDVIYLDYSKNMIILSEDWEYEGIVKPGFSDKWGVGLTKHGNLMGFIPGIILSVKNVQTGELLYEYGKTKIPT